VHRLRGRASNRRLAESLRAKVLKLVKAKDGDFGPTLGCGYLAKEHAVAVSKETLRQWMMAAGMRRGKRRQVEEVRVRRSVRKRWLRRRQRGGIAVDSGLMYTAGWLRQQRERSGHLSTSSGPTWSFALELCRVFY